MFELHKSESFTSWYIDYSRFEEELELDGAHELVQYQSLTAGGSLFLVPPRNAQWSPYFDFGGGLGASKFDVTKDRLWGVAEAHFEGGFSWNGTINLGLGVKTQVIGRIGETAATTANLYLSLGVRF